MLHIFTIQMHNNVKNTIQGEVNLIKFAQNKGTAVNKTLYSRLDDLFSGLYGTSWENRKKNEHEITYWKFMLNRMSKEELKKAVTDIQKNPSPHPKYAPRPQEFQLLGHIPKESTFVGECCYRYENGNLCRSQLNVRSFIDNRIDKRYCSAHYPEENREPSELEIELRKNGLGMFDFIMINVGQAGGRVLGKKVYTEEQIKLAVQLKNRKSKDNENNEKKK